MLSNFFFFQGISMRTLDKPEEKPKSPTYFFKDLNKIQTEIPWEDIDETWVILKNQSEERGIISVINRTKYTAIGKESECDPVKLLYDVQLEVERYQNRYYLVDAMRYEREDLCKKTLSQRLDSVPMEVYQKLNVIPRDLVNYTIQEQCRIREFDDINASYILQKLDDPYLGCRYKITYAQVVEDILRKAKRMVKMEIYHPDESEDEIEKDVPQRDQEDIRKVVCASRYVANIIDMPISKGKIIKGSNTERKAREREFKYFSEIEPDQPKKISKIRAKMKLKKQVPEENRDINRYYDVVNRAKD